MVGFYWITAATGKPPRSSAVRHIMPGTPITLHSIGVMPEIAPARK